MVLIIHRSRSTNTDEKEKNERKQSTKKERVPKKKKKKKQEEKKKAKKNKLPNVYYHYPFVFFHNQFKLNIMLKQNKRCFPLSLKGAIKTVR